MGKGQIISGGDAGLYSITIDYDDERKAAALARINSQIDFYEDQIETLTDANAIARRRLWVAALRKRRDFLLNPSICPTDETVSAWCADLTEDLSGTVGTIEINSVTGKVLIRPGYEDGAAWSVLRDGQMQAMLAQEPAAALLNYMFHDGRQKWKPRHRVGTLTSVDHETDLCAVSLDSAAGQMTGSDINLTSSLSSVPIDYMSCNSAPFEAGDRVVVEFTDNEWTSPVVIGFESNPKSCDHDFVIITANPRPWDPDTPEVFTPDQWSIVWDVGMNAMAAEIPASATPGDFLTFPCPTDDLAYWASITEERANSASLTWNIVDDIGEDWSDPWKINPGVEYYQEDSEGVVCSPAMYDEWELSDFNYNTYRQDKYIWDSATNVASGTCSQRTHWVAWRDYGDYVDGKIYPGTPVQPMGWMQMNSPLGAFETFLHNCQLYKTEYYNIFYPPTSYMNFYRVPYPYYKNEWWSDGYPTLSPHAVYSKNSHVQIHAHYDRIERVETIGGGPTLGDPWVYETIKMSKLQIHAAASYHPNAEGEGGINANPLSLPRNNDFEDAILDLMKTQLQAEDATHGEDWSLWQLDGDLNPEWPGPGDSSFFDSAATETWQIPLLYSLSFDIQFRQTPEE
jgi:hypothetical protein